MRVGMGYDVHRLTEDRDLILGGVKRVEADLNGSELSFTIPAGRLRERS